MRRPILLCLAALLVPSAPILPHQEAEVHHPKVKPLTEKRWKGCQQRQERWACSKGCGCDDCGCDDCGCGSCGQQNCGCDQCDEPCPFCRREQVVYGCMLCPAADPEDSRWRNYRCWQCKCCKCKCKRLNNIRYCEENITVLRPR